MSTARGPARFLPGNWDVLWSLSVEGGLLPAFSAGLFDLSQGNRVLLLPLLCLIIAGPVNRTLLADQDPWRGLCLSILHGWRRIWLRGGACLCETTAVEAHPSNRFGTRTTVSSLVIVLCNEDTHSGLSRFGLNVTVLEAGIAFDAVVFGSGVGNGALSRGTYWLRVIGRKQLRNLLVPHARRTELDGFVQNGYNRRRQ